jgi:diadenylate cyclase
MQELTDAITTYFQRISSYNPWVVLVQLLLIGVVIWLIMRFLRGTRGARLVKGAALLLAIIFIVIRLLPKDDEWKRVEFLYGNFLLFAFFAVLVAFQPELRRALISIGQARLFRGKQGEIADMIDELILSSSYFSRNKIGAIIAIERSVGLGALIETGTRIDSRVTADLLNTIFYPGTPLHDMGVIIHDRRIAAAGCQFPMAESEEVDPALGSRHRAALGLANDSDAVVLVVSEETGRVSLAYEGQLIIGIEQENVRKILLDLLAPKAARAPRPPAEEPAAQEASS